MKLGSEAIVQINLMNWLAHNYPDIREHTIMIGNEGKRSVQGNLTARRMGLHKFASDIFIAYPCNGFHGAFIEIKKDGWKPTPSTKEHTAGQMDFIEKMDKCGYFSKFCIGLDECKEAIIEYAS